MYTYIDITFVHLYFIYFKFFMSVCTSSLVLYCLSLFLVLSLGIRFLLHSSNSKYPSFSGNFKPGVYAVSVTGRLPQGNL